MPATLSSSQIRADAEMFMQEMFREEYLALSGQKATPEFDDIFDRHAAFLARDAIGVMVEGISGKADDEESRRGNRLLLNWIVRLVGIRAAAPALQKKLSIQARCAVTSASGRQVPYPRVAVEIADEVDAEARRALDEARLEIAERELSRIAREALEIGRANIESLELAPGYIGTWELLNQISLRALAVDADAFLHRTELLWDTVRGELVRRRLGIDPKSATSADALALFRARDFDAYFSQGQQAGLLEKIGKMGLDPQASGRIILDLADRPGKHSRAGCAPVRVPDEVYLMVLPMGGQKHWHYFLHELGHALHFAYTDRTHAIEYRRFGELTVTETYAALFDHLLHDGLWLSRNTELGGRTSDFLRLKAAEDLHTARRFCAKLLYELELYDGSIDRSDLPSRYAELMRRGTAFAHSACDAFLEVDPYFISVAYLRATFLLPALVTELIARFDVDWWANPRTGEWLIGELFVHGGHESGDEIAQRVTGKGIEFERLLTHLESRLS